MSGPSGDRLIRVDMTNQTVNIEAFPDEWKLLGGRGLSAKILLAECDPECDPLGPDNLLVIAPGVLAGTAAPTSGRISIGGKSPLTNGIKEANAGGNPGQDLMKLGYRAIVVTGKPQDAGQIKTIGTRQVGRERSDTHRLDRLAKRTGPRHRKTNRIVRRGRTAGRQLPGGRRFGRAKKSSRPLGHFLGLFGKQQPARNEWVAIGIVARDNPGRVAPRGQQGRDRISIPGVTPPVVIQVQT